MDEVNQPVTTPQTPQTPDQMHSSSEESHNSRIILIIIAVVVLVLVGAGSYVLGTKNSQPTAENITQTTPIPSPIPTIDATATWKTYTNDKLGFSLKIPLAFNSYESTEGPEAGERIDIAESKPFSLNKYWVWISKTPNVDRLTVDELDQNYLNAKSTYKDGKYISINEQPELVNKIIRESLTVNGNKATSLYPITSATDTKIVSIAIDQYHYVIALQAGTDPTLNNEAMEFFDQILSTFRFTN